jgi:alginate O-acetyltransferase complex protein AlgJ
LRAAELPPARLDNKVVIGKDGWLFLGNDTNQVLSQHVGDIRFTEPQLRQWRFLLETRIAWLARRNVDHLFLVAPNPHSVYTEMLPDGYGDGASRPVLQLLDHLDSSGSYAEVMYPVQELRAAKPRPVYSKVETHWTELGAFVAYQSLMPRVVRTAPTRVLTEADLTIHEITWSGDLGVKLDPPVIGTSPWLNVQEPRARLVSDNRIFNHGRRIDYECEAAPDLRCLVYGDSFSVRLLPLLAESFRTLVFAHIATLDYTLVETVSPDVVICVMNERFLTSVPDDLTGPTLQEFEAGKRAAGQMFVERQWEGNRVDSPMPSWFLEKITGD